MGKATIILTTYNNQERISYTLNSLLHQTCNDFQLLIIDDCSDDETIKIVKNYYNKFSDMNIIEKERNKGLIDSLNIGIRESKSDIIIRHDAEDISHKNRIEILLKEYEKNSGISCITTSCFLLYQNYNFIGYLPIIKINNVNILLDLNINRIYHAGVLYNKNHVIDAGYYPAVPHCEDYALWKKMRNLKMKFKFIDLPLYAFFRENSGISYTHNYEQRINYYIHSKKIFSENLINRSQRNQDMKNHIVFDLPSTMPTKKGMLFMYYKLQRMINNSNMSKYKSYINGFEYDI